MLITPRCVFRGPPCEVLPTAVDALVMSDYRPLRFRCYPLLCLLGYSQGPFGHRDASTSGDRQAYLCKRSLLAACRECGL